MVEAADRADRPWRPDAGGRVLELRAAFVPGLPRQRPASPDRSNGQRDHRRAARIRDRGAGPPLMMIHGQKPGRRPARGDGFRIRGSCFAHGLCARQASRIVAAFALWLPAQWLSAGCVRPTKIRLMCWWNCIDQSRLSTASRVSRRICPGGLTRGRIRLAPTAEPLFAPPLDRSGGEPTGPIPVAFQAAGCNRPRRRAGCWVVRYAVDSVPFRNTCAGYAACARLLATDTGAA